MDYNRNITRQCLDIESYSTKFKQCMALLQMENPDPVMYRNLLKDPTTFSYLFFKNNKNERLQMYPYQDAILNDVHRYIYFRAANQIGKSFLFNVKAARNLIIDHGETHNEAIVSKSLPQAIDQMRRVKTLLNTSQFADTWKESTGLSDSMSVITIDIKDEKGKYKYTNTLVCAPCTEGLLGYALHELNLDEFEFWDIDLKYFFNQIAQPRTYSTKGNILVMSNPNGQDNFGADLEKQIVVKTGDKKWHVYEFNFLDKPGNTREEYDQLKSELSRSEFESTVAAIRSLSDRNYFSPDEIERSYDKNVSDLSMVGKQPFFFLDVGAKKDQSVLVGGYMEPDEEKTDKNGEPMMHVHIPIIELYPVGYPLTRVVGAEAPDEDGWHHVKSVKEYLEEWSVDGIIPMFGVDVTGNSGISPLFETVGINAEDVTFSGPVKSGMYQRFKWYMEKGLLHRVRNKDWEYQAGHLEVKKSARGYLMIHHQNEDDHDDCMDATAGLIHLMDDPNLIKPSMRLF